MAPKVVQSDPKGLQNGALAGHFDDFFCKKPTLHPTAYLVCFKHILKVLGSPVSKTFLLEMSVGCRSPKKLALYQFFSSLSENVSKWVPTWWGEKVKKSISFCSFSHRSPFGCPWLQFHCLWGSLGIIFAPFQVLWASFWHPWALPK